MLSILKMMIKKSYFIESQPPKTKNVLEIAQWGMVSALVIFEGFRLNRIPNKCVFIIILASIFLSTLGIYIIYSLWWNEYLNCITLRQSLRIQANKTAM